MTGQDQFKIDEIESAGGEFVLKTYQEEYLDDSPRDWDNLGVMVCVHSRYTLGDKHYGEGREAVYETLKELGYDREQLEMHSEWMGGGAFIEKYMPKIEKFAFVLPLYLYDHSGITINTTGFSCPWDSGQVGFVYATKEKVRKEWKVKRIGKKLREKVFNILRGEVETYDQYLRGDVYWWVVEDADGEVMDSCGGYYGSEGYDRMVEEGKELMHRWEVAT